MASRVYWIQLSFLTRGLAKYIGRYTTQLQESLTSEQYACVAALLTAAQECLALLPHNNPSN